MKNINRSENIVRNISWGILNRIVMLILPFISRTVMIYMMGNVYVGLDSLFASILQVLNLSELGISSAIVFAMYKPIAQDNTEEICALLNFYKMCYRVIGIVIGLLGLIIVPMIHYFIAGDVPKDINVYLVYGIVLFNLVLSYEYLPYSESVLIANQRRDIITRIRTLLVCMQLIIQIVVLLISHNYYIYLSVCLITTVLQNTIIRTTQVRLFPKYICKGYITDENKSEILKNVKGMIYTKIGYIILVQVDTIVISSFLGLEILGIYQNYYYVITAISGILQMISDSIVPTIGNTIAVESVDKNYEHFKVMNFMYAWIVSWFSIGLCVLWVPFMNMWIGESANLPISLVFVMIVCFYIHRSQDMLGIYQYACGLWWETRYVSVFAAGINLSLNILLVSKIGLYGIVLSTIVSIVCIYIPGFCHGLYQYYFRDMGKEKEFYWTFVKRTIIVICATIVTTCSANLLGKAIGINAIRILVDIVIVLIFPNICMALLYKNDIQFQKSIKIIRGLLIKTRLFGEKNN